MRFSRLFLVCVPLTLMTCIRATSINRMDQHGSIRSNIKRAETDDPNSIFDEAERFRNSEKKLPKATSIEELDPNCAEVDDLRFHARLCRTVNCRQSLNNWDCENCTSILPDGEVLVYFNTAPHEIVGQIVRSKSKKTIYIQIRGAATKQNRILSIRSTLINHPTIPGAQVNSGCLLAFNDLKTPLFTVLEDQLTLHPDYKYHVIGHSFGSCVASLASVEMQSRLSTLRPENHVLYTFGKHRFANKDYADYQRSLGFEHKRVVYRNDPVVHRLLLQDGYYHDGTEYWQYDSAMHTKKCLGGEVRDCSNTAGRGDTIDHLWYYGVYQGCSQELDE